MKKSVGINPIFAASSTFMFDYSYLFLPICNGSIDQLRAKGSEKIRPAISIIEDKAHISTIWRIIALRMSMASQMNGTVRLSAVKVGMTVLVTSSSIKGRSTRVGGANRLHHTSPHFFIII